MKKIVLAAALSVAGISLLADAQFTARETSRVVSSHDNGDGTFDVVARSSGVATFLGRYSGELRYNYNPNNETITGTETLTAANGDTIVNSFTCVETEEGFYDGCYTMLSGTGRFAGVHSGGDMDGTELSEGVISYLITGDFVRN